MALNVAWLGVEHPEDMVASVVEPDGTQAVMPTEPRKYHCTAVPYGVLAWLLEALVGHDASTPRDHPLYTKLRLRAQYHHYDEQRANP